jgi:hypothetical protein
MPTQLANIQVWEQECERSAQIGDKAEYSTKYSVIGTADEMTALALVYDAAQATWGSLFFPETYHAQQVGPDTWEVDVTYGSVGMPTPKSQTSTDPNSGTWKLSWDMTGGTTHISQSLQTVHRVANAGLCPNGPPDFKGAIGVSDSGVAGCDIHTPVFQWHETRSIPRKIACSFSYLRALYKLVGRTNDAVFRGFPVGDVLFFGARGEIDTKDPRFCDVTFNFAASETISQIQVGPCDPIDKGGWEYLWVLYHESIDATAKYKIKVPAAVYVERVYRPGDYSTLKIGT